MTDYRRAADQAGLKIHKGIKGTVKWFNPVLGHGFIIPDPGQAVTRDILISTTNLSDNGIGAIFDGQRVECDVLEGHKGYKVPYRGKVAKLGDNITAQKLRSGAMDIDIPDTLPEEDIQRGVKVSVLWYSGVRGFGFVCPVDADPQDKNKHIFVHAEVLRAMRKTRLREGVELTVDVWLKAPKNNGRMVIPTGHKGAQRPTAQLAAKARGTGLGSDE